MKIMLSVLILMLCAVSPAQAQKVYLQPNDTETREKTQAPDADINDLANRYYQNCLMVERGPMRGQTLEMLCACTSAHISKKLTAQEMQEVFEDGPRSTAITQKIIGEIYVPCMELPVQDLVRESCLQNPQVTQAIPDPQGACTCLAEKSAAYVTSKGQEVISKNPDQDPQALLQNLMQSTEFHQQSQAFVMDCVMNEG